MKFSNQLPKSIEKTINDLARSREKAAKQKYLIDLGESLVMHLCAFVLGEYKNQSQTSLELEKSFIKNSKNVSFGIYLGWLREASKFLNQQQTPSEIHALLHASNDFQELSEFIKSFEKLKGMVEENNGQSYSPRIQEILSKEKVGKTNLLQFFDAFIQLRNRVAHPHKEIKGKVVTWPFTEDYFDATNPYIEAALTRCINELNQIWEFKHFIIECYEDGILTLKQEDSEDLKKLEYRTNYQEGIKVFANSNNTVLLSDWKVLLQAGEEALSRIREEENELRNKASIEDLKEAIVAALDDQQISLEELNFFESLGKTKLGLNKEAIKKLIEEVATSMGIEDPFPEVDKRFIEAIDLAITTSTYNEFLLKLTGQQYGVDHEKFEALFLERTFVLGADADEIRKNRVIQFSMEELQAYQGLLQAQRWIMNIYLFNRQSKESFYKIKDDSNVYGTKEYWHKNAFANLENFVISRLKKLNSNSEAQWETKQNNWQIGAMTGYAWCALYPKNLPSKRVLALHFSLYGDGSAAIGFLPDWKDYKQIENFGLLLQVFTNHLMDFANKYAHDLKKYPQLMLWDTINNNTAYSFNEAVKLPWIFEHLYGFDQIQFMHKEKESSENPSLFIDHFDIIFNLFNGLFETVNRDYLNLLNQEYQIAKHEGIISEKLQSLTDLLKKHGLGEKGNEEKTGNTEEGDLEQGVNMAEPISSNQFLQGYPSLGKIYIEYRSKEKGYPITLSFIIKQDYEHDGLNYLIQLSCAGYLESTLHQKIETVLKELSTQDLKGNKLFFMRSKLLMVSPISDIESFDIVEITRIFLEALSQKCSEKMVSFLGLKINSETFSPFEQASLPLMDLLNPQLENNFKNKIYHERNWMMGNRFIDYVYSNKGVTHWIGWGMKIENERIHAGVIFRVEDALKGAIFKEQMEHLALSDSEWEFIQRNNSNSNSEIQEIRLMESNVITTSASSAYNRNYAPKNASKSLEKGYWCPSKNEKGEWWQLELIQPMELLKIELQGCSNTKSYVSNFSLLTSLDGKNWNTHENCGGLESQEDETVIEFPSTPTFRYLRIVPTEFQGWPILKLEVIGRTIAPEQMELRWLNPLENTAQIQEIFDEIPSKVTKLLGMKGMGV